MRLLTPKYIVLIFTIIGAIGLYAYNQKSNFLKSQLKYKRVKTAYNLKFDSIQSQLKKMGLTHSKLKLYIIAYKNEKEMCIFVSNSNKEYKLFKKYSVCAQSGNLGPKFKSGDNQTPEGFYLIDRFNPSSSFLLSLGLNYPNKADKIRSNAADLGGDIFIHGNCVSIGCLAMTDAQINEIYLLTVLAKNAGQNSIPVVISPFKFQNNKPAFFKTDKNYASYKAHFGLWESIENGITYFNKNSTPPIVTINKTGNYTIQK